MWGDWVFTAPGGREHTVKNGPTYHEAKAIASIELGVPADRLACVNVPDDTVGTGESVDVWRAFKPKVKPGFVEVTAPCGCLCHVESPRGLNAPITSVLRQCARHRRRNRSV